MFLRDATLPLSLSSMTARSLDSFDANFLLLLFTRGVVSPFAPSTAHAGQRPASGNEDFNRGVVTVYLQRHLEQNVTCGPGRAADFFRAGSGTLSSSSLYSSLLLCLPFFFAAVFRFFWVTVARVDLEPALFRTFQEVESDDEAMATSTSMAPNPSAVSVAETVVAATKAPSACVSPLLPGKPAGEVAADARLLPTDEASDCSG